MLKQVKFYNTGLNSENIEIPSSALELGRLFGKRDILRESLQDIKTLRPEQARLRMDEKLSLMTAYSEKLETVKPTLTDEEKALVKKETGWSDKIIDALSSMKEYESYKKAGLREAVIDGRTCLIRSDIDWNKKSSTALRDKNGNPVSLTNRERARRGQAPLDNEGKRIQLHHIGQLHDSPLAELTEKEHQSAENTKILHRRNTQDGSDIDRDVFDKERSRHWRARGMDVSQ